jgi:hypothetical protein
MNQLSLLQRCVDIESFNIYIGVALILHEKKVDEISQQLFLNLAYSKNVLRY